MDISTWLKNATKQLKDIGIQSSRLDAELILAETLRKPRTYLHAYLDNQIDPRRVDIANARLQLRLDRVPLAYILGYKEFYGRQFIVSPSVLVPRPESEDMITLLLEVSSSDISTTKTLIDVGAGSGCIGITAKLERPDMSVTLADISPQALQIAQENAHKLNANVRTQKQNLLQGQIEPLNYILANLPYVDRTWEVSPELRHEPEQALFARDGGLELIYRLIQQASDKLLPGGWLLLEADPEQHRQIIDFATNYNLSHYKTLGYCVALRIVAT